MDEFMKTLLSLSVSGTLLVLLVWGLKPLHKNKFSRRWQYYIWLIAALRFLLPFTPDTTIVGNLFEKFDTLVITNEIPINPKVPAAVNTDYSETEQAQAGNHVMTGTVTRNPLNIYVCIFFIWAVLALVLFVRKITIYQGFIQYTKAGNVEVSDIKILNLLSDCKEKLNIKTRVELYQNALIASPMITGFFYPNIVLPVREVEEKDLSYVFAHELLHYKHKDIFYKWLIQIVICIHWFNPLVYLLGKEVNKACELSCDERLISILDDKARREYGDMLISFMKSNNLYKNSFVSVTLTEGAEQLKERLGAIMQFKKKSKTVIFVTTICTVAICFCFLATGAYAAPSANDKGAVWQNKEIRNEALTEDGVYYIFCDGAGENDKPQSSVSVGNIQFVLVRKESYTSIGPFSDSDTLTEEVSKQCDTMLKRKMITEEEKNLVLDTAKNIENNNRYTYVHDVYYSDSYIIGMGWNLNDTIMSKDYYTDSIEITLEDNSTILVCFGDLFFGDADGNAADYLNDSDAISAIGKLIYSLKKRNMPNYPTLETPLVTSITYVGENLPALAEEYLESNNITGFSAILPALDAELQKAYCQKMYDNDEIAYFSRIIPYMDRDSILLYADQADQDMKMNFFSVISRYMQSEDLNKFAEKYYETNNIARFAVIVPYMTESEKQEWLIKAQTDKKNNFSMVLLNQLPK